MEYKYKKERPKVDGFYWFMGSIKGYHENFHDIGPVVVSVVTIILTPEVFFPEGSSSGVLLDDLNGQWAGPLMPPEMFYDKS